MGWKVYDKYGAEKIASRPAYTTYRKTTAKQVGNSIVETDLLEGEFTIGAAVMGTNKVLHFYASGDLNNNSGGVQKVPQFKLKLGGTTLIDTGMPSGTPWYNNTDRYEWSVEAWIANLTASSQWTRFKLMFGMFTNGTGMTPTKLVTGEGVYTSYSSATPHNYALMGAEGGFASAIDTSLARLLELATILPVAHVSCDITLKRALAVIL